MQVIKVGGVPVAALVPSAGAGFLFNRWRCFAMASVNPFNKGGRFLSRQGARYGSPYGPQRGKR